MKLEILATNGVSLTGQKPIEIISLKKSKKKPIYPVRDHLSEKKLIATSVPLGTPYK